jgi:glyoxylase-like metal-dependent hydrolase (beta-lactamase superfamily II)
MNTLYDWRRDGLRPIFATLPRVSGCGDWFAVFDLGRDTFALCEPDHNEEVISFLLIGRERALLIDTGMGFVPIKPLAMRLTHLPISVLNTHTHFDHTGGNHEFDEIAAFETPLSRARQSDGERAAWAGQLTPEHVRGAWPAGVDPATFVTRPYRVTRWVSDGDVIDLGGRPLELLHTPGHSADSLSIVDHAQRQMLTADQFYEGPIYLTNQDSDVAAFTRSARRMASHAQRVDRLLPSHNTPIAAPGYLASLADAAEHVARSQTRGRAAFDGFEIWT